MTFFWVDEPQKLYNARTPPSQWKINRPYLFTQNLEYNGCRMGGRGRKGRKDGGVREERKHGKLRKRRKDGVIMKGEEGMGRKEGRKGEGKR